MRLSDIKWEESDYFRTAHVYRGRIWVGRITLMTHDYEHAAPEFARGTYTITEYRAPCREWTGLSPLAAQIVLNELTKKPSVVRALAARPGNTIMFIGAFIMGATLLFAGDTFALLIALLSMLFSACGMSIDYRLYDPPLADDD